MAQSTPLRMHGSAPAEAVDRERHLLADHEPREDSLTSRAEAALPRRS
jgi:hypothetical protein